MVELGGLVLQGDLHHQLAIEAPTGDFLECHAPNIVVYGEALAKLIYIDNVAAISTKPEVADQCIQQMVARLRLLDISCTLSENLFHSYWRLFGYLFNAFRKLFGHLFDTAWTGVGDFKTICLMV